LNFPFTSAEFFALFEAYNSSVFPIQIILLALGIMALALVLSKSFWKNMFTGSLLGVLWLWLGIVYHLAFFTSINRAAYAFGAISVLQGLFFFIEVFRKRLGFSFSGRLRDYLGYFFILFGLLIYPLISYLLEGSWIRTISVGLPCPTTILTFGFLMWSGPNFPRYLLIIPTIWAIIGTGAAAYFGVYQDYVMLIAALAANVYLLRRKKSS
jgi:hypothetical protein